MSRLINSCSSSAALVAEAVSWYSSLLLVLAVVMVLSISCCCCDPGAGESRAETSVNYSWACEEIYVVREGETLQTISDKCGDPYIVEENPHIHDPDDVFPGLVIKITPFKKLAT